jgi:hypothetical protein
MKIPKIVLFIVLFLATKIIQQYLSNGTTSVATIFLLKGMLIGALQAPFEFIICHFMYYGFMVCFLCIYWGKSVERYAKYGYSFSFVIAIGLIMSLNPESRHFITFVPFYIFPLIELVNKSLNVKFAVAFAVASLALSRFWFKINVPGIEDAFAYGTRTSYELFPAQRYFMSYGPWMSYSMYFVFAGIFIASCACILFYLKRKNIFIQNNDKIS